MSTRLCYASAMKTCVIGAGVAGTSVAAALSRAGEQVVLYSEEPTGFYPRPRLPEALGSREALMSLVAKSDPPYLVHDTVLSIDPQAHTLALSDGSSAGWDKLVLATGSRPRTLPLFDGMEGVGPLRTLSDAEKLLCLEDPVCVLGGGLLGIETATALAKAGHQVTVLEGSARIMVRQLDLESSSWLKEKLLAQGIQCLENFMTSGMEAEGRRLRALASADGRRVECRSLVFSLGVNPETTLARNAGIKVNRGIVVDEHMRTNAEDVYAIGDCAEYQGQVPGLMPVAMAQATACANAILGKNGVYVPAMPMARLQEEGFDLISLGTIADFDHKDGGVSFFRRNGVLSGAILVDSSSRLREVKALLSAS